jgi:hypothetical protein
MGHGRMQRLTEVESQCFRCDRREGLREDKTRPNRSLSVSVLILNE